MKAILINVEAQEVKEIEIEGGYQSIQKAIGCGTITAPITYDNGDTMYCDDESLLFPDSIKGAFIYPDWAYPIVSNAVILGCDDEGESIDVKSSIEELKKGLRFIPVEDAALSSYIDQYR